MELKKMELTSASGSELNLEALYQIMPSAFTEVRDDKTGEIVHKINFNTLHCSPTRSIFIRVKIN